MLGLLNEVKKNALYGGHVCPSVTYNRAQTFLKSGVTH